MAGKSLGKLLKSDKSGIVERGRRPVFSARERHSSSRYQNWTYPQRAMRTQQYLLIRNFRPDRWPAGAPQKLNSNGSLGPMHEAYHDIDACPSLTFLVKNRDDPQWDRFFQWSVAKRPAWELFDVKKDPGCLQNLIDTDQVRAVQSRLKEELESYLTQTKDPRILDGGDVFETYRRYSRMRKFPDPAEKP